MKIDISLNSIDEIRELLREFGWATCESAGRPTGWVSHPIADLSKEPPSVITTATTESAHDGGADIDIDKGKDVRPDETDWVEAYARAESVAAFIIKNLLDFEAWLDGRLSGDEDAAVERVRFHADVSYDGRAMSMRQLTEYRNADRRMVPREDGLIRKWELPDDDALEDFEANVVRDCVSWVCNEFGFEIEEYLDKDEKAGGGDTDETCEAHERHEDSGDITEEAMVDAATDEAAAVWRVVNEKLSVLEEWVKGKMGKRRLSAFVTVFEDTVKVRLDDLDDMGRGPLMVMETKVGYGWHPSVTTDSILAEAYNVVFCTFNELSYIEFIESISVATDAPHDADNEEFE